MRFCLWEVIKDARLETLEELISANIGGIGGEPGWELERRSSPDEAESSSGTAWPPDAEFHAWTDPGEGLSLDPPESFMSRKEFADLALTMLANHFDDLHGKTVAARRALKSARQTAAPLIEKLENLRDGA